MRPLKLVVKGFGTYLEKQDLDFELLKDKNIFVITGDTGAGKTTVFDAINYALYGDASGKEREGISFRSDFARPDEETSVELWFALRDKTYYVKREPSYMEKKVRGEGEKEHKAYAELKLADGKIITGIKPVTLEVEKILGINKDQFRQIVMIPQGEFKKLLTADSQEREKIFRKIFGTDVFEKMQNRINAEANELDKEVKLKRYERDSKLKDFDCRESDEELYRILQSQTMNLEEVFKKAKEVIVRDKSLEKQTGEALLSAEKAITELHKELIQGEAVNKKFEDLIGCEKALKTLEGEQEGYQEKNLSLEKARKALTVRNFEEKWESKRDTYNKHAENLKRAELEQSKLKQDHDKALRQLEVEKEKESQKRQLEKALNEAEKLKGKAQKYDSSKEKMLALEKDVLKLRERLTQQNQALADKEAALKVAEQTMETIIQAEQDKLQAESRLKEELLKKEDLNAFEAALQGLENKKKEHNILKQSFERFSQEFEELKTSYEQIEDIFRRGQAGLLAKTLQENRPCPVCGSLEHPMPALLLDETVNEEAVDRAKAAYEKGRNTRDGYLNKLTELTTAIQSILEGQLRPLNKKLFHREDVTSFESSFSDLENALKDNEARIAKETSRLGQVQKLIQQKESNQQVKERLSKELIVVRDLLSQDNESLTVKQGEFGASQEQLRMIEEEFEGEVKTYAEILEGMAAMTKQLEALDKAYRDAEKVYQSCAKALGEIEGGISTIKSNIAFSLKERDEAVAVFKQQTLALGFADYKDYKAFSKTQEEIEALDQQIKRFSENLEAHKKLYEKAQAAVKDLKPIDLEILKEKLALENAQKTKMTREQQMLFARIQSNQKILKEAQALGEKISSKEERYKLVGELAKVMKGDNAYKISFERYVLAAYFNDIIEASNTKFRKMTGGRFELLRKTDKGDARSQQGLDLEVMDHYTGKSRPVETLSGGESFKASLAMALGLADVVQAYAGGIQLDTMFVDEGFGTLDPESLENAIACLVGLQESGRLVGIISHVPELKERIDARLEVTRIARGSKAVFRL